MVEREEMEHVEPPEPELDENTRQNTDDDLLRDEERTKDELSIR